MKQIISPEGGIACGLFDEPVDLMNYLDFRLETPMGFRVPRFLRRMKFNQFVFVGIIGPEVMIGAAVVDLKIVTNGFFYVYDRRDRRMIEMSRLMPPGPHVKIKADPENVYSRFATRSLAISMIDGTFTAHGRGASLKASINRHSTSPLRICSRAGYRGWVFTQKTTPMEVTGSVSFNGRDIDLSSPGYMALMDWTAGYMRRQTYWNWAATATTLPDGRPFGLNLSCGVNETSFTENACWLDNRMVKTDTVAFDFDANDLYAPWRIRSNDRKVDLRFLPETRRSEHTNAVILASRFTQLMGRFEGTVSDGEGGTVKLADVPGWAEDHFARW